MNIDSIKTALYQLAQKEGITVDELKHEISIAISLAQKTNDPKILEYWRQIPCKGTYPTPEELIKFLIEHLNLENSPCTEKP